MLTIHISLLQCSGVKRSFGYLKKKEVKLPLLFHFITNCLWIVRVSKNLIHKFVTVFSATEHILYIVAQIFSNASQWIIAWCDYVIDAIPA